MGTRRTVQRDDRGETLVELVVAIAILGIAAVAILQGLMVSIQSSVMHRNDASAGAYVRSFAEAIQTDVDNHGYKTCANALSGYTGVAVPQLPSGYTKTVTAVQSWTGSTWGPCTSDGVQRLDLRVTTAGDALHRADEKLTVILRPPCNGSAAAPGANPCG